MKFSTKLKRVTSRGKFRLKKHSPEILVTVGAVGTVAAGIMACVATSKLPETLDACRERKEKLEEFKKKAEEVDETGVQVSYDQSQYRKDCAKVYLNNAWDVVKLYGPAFCVEAASLSMIFTSNSIHRKRTASAAAAYATLDSMFKQYRKNVVDTFGEDIDHDMRYGVKHEKVEITETDAKGKEHKRKVKEDVVNPDDPALISDYAKFYDESCEGWDKNPEYNLMTLKANQKYCNHILQTQGYMFLNDVYKIIGIKPTLAGQTVGWVVDPKDPHATYIDFGIFNTNRANRRFVNGLEPVILLDFNVQGDIMNNPRLSKLISLR